MVFMNSAAAEAECCKFDCKRSAVRAPCGVCVRACALACVCILARASIHTRCRLKCARLSFDVHVSIALLCCCCCCWCRGNWMCDSHPKERKEKSPFSPGRELFQSQHASVQGTSPKSEAYSFNWWTSNGFPSLPTPHCHSHCWRFGIRGKHKMARATAHVAATPSSLRHVEQSVLLFAFSFLLLLGS